MRQATCCAMSALAVASLCLSTPSAIAQRTKTKEPLFGLSESGGAAAQCYDASRVSEAGRRSMARLGTPPCPSSADSSSVEVPQAPPSSDRRPANRRWYASNTFVGVDDSGGINLTLGAYCSGTPLKPKVTIDPLFLIRAYDGNGPEKIEYQERLRTFANETVLTLDAMSSNGQKIATMVFNRRGQAGNAHFWREVTRAELNALRASSYIIASTSAWHTRFTGTGATAALSGMQC